MSKHDTPQRQPALQAVLGRIRGPDHRGMRVAPNATTHRLLLAAGLLGSVLFNLTFLLDGALRPGYDSLRQPISALSLGPAGWVQIANFIVFGALSCCSAIGWRATLAPGIGARGYPALKVLSGLALIAAGIFSQDPALGFPHGAPSPAHPTMHAQIHNAATVVSLLATIAGLLVLAHRFRHEPHWKTWSRYAVLAAALMIGFIAAFGATNNGGMFEKLATLTAMVFMVALIGRLLTGDARLSGPPTTTPQVAPPAASRTGPPHEGPNATMRWPRWVAPIVILGALLTATGAVTALLASGEHLNTAGQHYADYFITRNLAISVMLVLMLALRARRPLAALMALTALIQLLDAITAAITHRPGLIPIDLAYAAAFLLGAAQLSGHQLRHLHGRQRSPLPPAVHKHHLARDDDARQPPEDSSRRTRRSSSLLPDPGGQVQVIGAPAGVRAQLRNVARAAGVGHATLASHRRICAGSTTPRSSTPYTNDPHG